MNFKFRQQDQFADSPFSIIQGHTANTANLNEDPEGGDAEICSAEPPADKMEAVPQKLQGDARKPLPAAEKPKKPTKNGQDTTRAAAALEIAPKRSQRRMEKIAKAEATAAAPSQKTVVNRAKITKVAKKTAPRAPRDAKTIPASATVQASPAEKKEKREQRLLAIREAAEKAAAVGGLTPPAPPSPGAEDFVDEEIIRSAEKKKRELEEAKILAQKPAVNKKSTTFSRKRKPGAKAIEEEKEDEEEGGGDEEQIDIEQPGPSSKHVAKPASKGKAAAEPTAARQSKRMRGDAPSPPAAAAAPKSKKKKNKKTITPVVGVTPPVDNNATAATTTLPVPTTAAPRNTIAAAGAAVDLSAMPPSALTAANATVAAIIDTFNDDDEDEDVEIEYIDHDHYADQSPAGAARDWIMAALSNPRGKEASSALLRESLENSVETIVSNIEGTISDGQNNSLLVLGGRGAGKTLAVERALTTISTQWNTDPADPLVGIVRLVGWAHADERTAFKEIARQLCGTFKLQFSRTASLGDNIEFLRTVLDGLARAHKVAVFVLDDFDLFAKRAKQTLLYCLLDALQTSGVQAVVIGTTVRHDCLDLLEKRVKSRFSHRSVMINPPSGALTIEPPRRDTASPGSGAGTSLSPGSGGVEEFPKEGSIEILRKMLSLPESFPHTAHMKAHNHAVNAAVEQKAVIKAINEFAAYRTNLHDLRNIAQATIAASSTHPRGLITQEDVISACSNLSKASDRGMEAYIAGLSVLELAVLVGAHRAARRVDGDPINFEMAFKEFYTYSTSGDHVDNYTKGAACKAFFKLAEMGLLSPSTGKADARVVSGNHFAPMYVQITALELRMGIDEHQKCPAKLKDWATREGGPLTTAAANLE
jgi:origin recognition complex subunit 4